MIHKRGKTERRGDFGMFGNDALYTLKGETFRIYCYLMSKQDDDDIRPNRIAKEMGISNRTVYNAYTSMEEHGFMVIDGDGKYIDTSGRLQSQKTYEFYEKPVSKSHRSKKETSVKSTQETSVKSTQETSVKSTQPYKDVIKYKKSSSKEGQKNERKNDDDDEYRISDFDTLVYSDEELFPFAQKLSCPVSDIRYILFKHDTCLPELKNGIRLATQNQRLHNIVGFLKSAHAWTKDPQTGRTLFNAASCEGRRGEPEDAESRRQYNDNMREILRRSLERDARKVEEQYGKTARSTKIATA